MPEEKKYKVEITLTEAQKAYLDKLGGNKSKRFRDAFRRQFPDFPLDAPFRVRKDYLENNPSLNNLRLAPEFIEAIEHMVALYNQGDVYQLDFMTEKYFQMGYSPGDISSEEMLQLLVQEGLVQVYD